MTVSDPNGLLNASSVAALIGLFIPALTALVTKWNVDARVRALVALALSAIAGAASALVAVDGGFSWQTFALAALTAFITNVTTYLGVYKPNGIAAAIAGFTPGFGLGSTRTEDGAHVITDLPPKEETP